MSYISKTAEIGENVKIGHFCVIEDDVVIGDNSIIENYAMVSKGSVIGVKLK